MTIGLTLAWARASRMTGANSVSVMTILLSAWSSMKAMIAASSRVLIECSTAPVIGTPKCASSIAGVLCSMTETVSPLPIPSRERAEASLRARA